MYVLRDQIRTGYPRAGGSIAYAIAHAFSKLLLDHTACSQACSTCTVLPGDLMLPSLEQHAVWGMLFQATEIPA